MALRHRTAKLPQVLATDRRLTDDGARVRRLMTRAFLSMPAAYEAPRYRTSWKVPKLEALGEPVRASRVLGDPTRHLRPRAEAQFRQDVLEMALNRSFRQEQALGDAATRHAGGNEPG